MNIKFETLENVTDITVDDDFRYLLKVKCGSCGEPHEKAVAVTKSEVVEMPGSRGEANVVMTCKFCNRHNSIDIVQERIQMYTGDDAGKFVPLASFEFRGVEPVGWDAGEGFKCKSSESSHTFTGIDMSEGEWCDYDDDGDVPVGIYSPEAEFVHAPKKKHGKH
eukprot:TRINITY_DN1289_c0_g1_i1.p1 TRINITY_DN1289_c0_g1~~TRINITY_DN1289_c0_g1_i1.p1  ORF type:complete len:164 (-),score=40.29 TRINITY_DN1289_c0_g1_i1:137-628(-)